MKFIRGDTEQARWEYVDRILSRFSRRLHKTVIGIIPPVPIHGYVDSSVNPVLRFMFCASGKISKGLIHVNQMPKDGVDIHAAIENDLGVTTKSYFTKKNRMAIEPGINVFSGDRLIVKVVPHNSEEEVYGIWLSMLWVPLMSDSETKEQLIDSLDEVEERYALREMK